MRYFQNKNFNGVCDHTNVSFIVSDVDSSLEKLEGRGAHFEEVEKTVFDLEISGDSKLWRICEFSFYGRM
jgi:aspartate oxidase